MPLCSMTGMTDPHPAPPLLTAHGLAFSRNEQRVFGPLDFSVEAGEALLVQGDNEILWRGTPR